MWVVRGGHIAIDLGPRVGRVHGIDVSGRLIEMAEARLAEAERARAAEGGAGGGGRDAEGVGLVAARSGNVSFEVGTVEGAELEAGAWDGVLAFSVLHLVDDAEATLARFHVLLVPGGRVLAEVPCTEDIGWALRRVIDVMWWVGKAPTVRLYSQAEWEAKFAAAGFEVEEVRVYNPKSRSRSILARRG
ncbi:MAG: class I SAM-dependent methyltransferase [Planctomycetota bacterium]